MDDKEDVTDSNYSLTKSGLDFLLDWLRFKLDVSELTGEFESDEKAAMLVAMMLPHFYAVNGWEVPK